ncbi:MAG: hypothetical protein GY863_21090 [bacterium]|nr:hypothetical protein [bacterium]
MFLRLLFYGIIFFMVYRFIKNLFIGSGKSDNNVRINRENEEKEKKINIDRDNIEDARYEDIDSDDKN